jgi:transposase-like protein
LICKKQFNERSGGVLNRTQYPSDVIAMVVLWRLRYKLSLRDLTEMFQVRGFVFSYEAVRDWEAKLTPALAQELRRRRKGKVGRSWYIDETHIQVRGNWKYLYRAIDRDGVLVDVMLSEHRDLAAARSFFRSAKAVAGVTPDRVTTDAGSLSPTTGPENRYSAVLFVEKEGFNALLAQARNAERFDIAIMSTKGMSTTAARLLLDRLAPRIDKVLVAHDFDVSGFSIFGTLGSNGRRYRFHNDVHIVDLGLRLSDVETLKLDSEPVETSGDWSARAATLAVHGAGCGGDQLPSSSPRRT